MEFYTKHNDKIICLLCRHKCKLKEKAKGMCGVNQNIDGKLKTLVYGYPSAMNIDPIEKKPLFHFLPKSKIFSIGTVGCNFRCPFCQNYSISQTNEFNKNKYYSPKEIALMAKNTNCKSIAFTYNEPTIFYPYAKDISKEAKKLGIKSVYVSNGIESREVIEDMNGVIDAINIDLKSFNAKYYKKTLKGKLEDVLDTILQIKKQNIWLEITTLIINNQNDSDEELNQIANFISKEVGKDTPWHISAFHPDYKMLSTKATNLSTIQRAYNIGKSHNLSYVYYGNTNEDINTNCKKCNTILIKRNRYNIMDNLITNGKCPICATKVDGVF